MQKTMEELFYGLSPSDKLYPKRKDFKKTLTEADICEEKFCERLLEKDKEDFDNLMFKRMTIYSYEVEQAFIDGFKIGANLIHEILSD